MTTTDEIKKAAAALRANRPAYQSLLDFYEALALAQEASKGKTNLEPIDIPKDLLAIKRKEKFPLIDTSDFSIDVESSTALLKTLCRLALETNEVLAEAGPRIAHALDHGTLQAATLFKEVLTRNDPYFEETAARLGMDQTILAFAAYQSVKPSICLCAEQLAAYLDDDSPWPKGYCPICGSPPALSVFRGEGGERSFLCSFCTHQWRTQRLYCPFCENQKQDKLHYFLNEGEEEYRVDVCDLCKRYIKTVDTRHLARPFSPVLEQIATLHLDMMAQEKGHKSGLPLWLQM